jgi:hypothetical protein
LAGAYAIQFHENGEKREKGYKLVSSFSLTAMQHFVKSMEESTLAPITDVMTVDFEIADGVFIAE